MNVLFFLKPKGDLAYVYDDCSLRQGLEKLERSGFTAIPMINREGKYIGTITEGDFLWSLKNKFLLDLKMAEDVPIQSVRRRMRFEPISIDSNMEDLVTKAMNQNFVPVLDDQKCFIGIITRKDIIKYFYQRCQAAQQAPVPEGEIHKLEVLSQAVRLGNGTDPL